MNEPILDQMRDWVEPGWCALSNFRNPSYGSCDNALLFSSHLMVLATPVQREVLKPWFSNIVKLCEVEPGNYRRRPDDGRENSHDDLTGVVVASYVTKLPFAKDAYTYGIYSDFSWSVGKPTEWSWSGWLVRIPDLEPTLRAAAGLKLGIVSQIKASLGYLANLFEERGETSGKLLLFLKAKVLQRKGKLIDSVIRIWMDRMSQVYPGGPREMYEIYFGISHVLTQMAPTQFDRGEGVNEDGKS